MDRKTAQHMRLKIHIFLSRPLQNNNVKSPKFAPSANGNRGQYLFSIWISTLSTYVLLRLSCGAVKDGKPMQPFSKIMIKNINSFLNGYRPWRCHPICLRTQISIFFIGYLSISRLSQSYEICKQSSIILIERSACSIINEVTGK